MVNEDNAGGVVVATAEVVERYDGWQNVILGIGGAKDPSTYTRHAARPKIPDTELESAYAEDHFAARVVEALPDAAIGAGWSLEVPGDPQDASEVRRAYATEEERLDAVAMIRRGAYWGRLFGGGVTWVGADDGRHPSQPLDEDSIKTVSFLHSFDRRDVTAETYYDDPRDAKFRKPRTYRIRSTPVRGFAGRGERRERGASPRMEMSGAGAFVHESRIIRWPGQEVTDRRRNTLQGWDDSVLERSWEALKQVAEDYGTKSMLLNRVSQTVLKIKDMWALLAGKKREVLDERVSLMNRARAVGRMQVIDVDEDLVNVTQPVAGVRDLIRESVIRLAASIPMPVSVLLGQSPAGIGADNLGDLIVWDAIVHTWRELVLRARHERLATLILRAQDGPTGGVEPKRWAMKYGVLRPMTRKERAEVGKLEAETDVLNIDRGVYSPEVAGFRYTSSGGEGIVLDEKEQAKRLERRKELAALPPKDNAELGTIAPRTSAVLEIVSGCVDGKWSRETAVAVLVEVHRHTKEQAEEILGPENFEKPKAPVIAPPPPGAPPGPAPEPQPGQGAGAPRGLPGVNDGGQREPDEG